MGQEYGVWLPKLKHIRMRKALTQGELAQKAGVARATINRAERNVGPISLPNVRKIAEALGVSPEELQAKEEPEEVAV